jgi:hypothetical protein
MDLIDDGPDSADAKMLATCKELKVTDIAPRMWEHLGEKARKLINTGIRNSVLQFDRGQDDKKIYQLRPIWAKQEKRPDQEYKREIHMMISLGKVVVIDTTVGEALSENVEKVEEVPDEWIRRFALLVNKLTEEDKISYGILGPPVSLPLATIEHGRIRFMLLLYCFSDFEKDELNEWLGNPAFIDEGGLGTEDWTNLPE